MDSWNMGIPLNRLEGDWPVSYRKVILEQSFICFNFSVGKQMYTWDRYVQETSRGNESQLQPPCPAQHQVTWYLCASISEVSLEQSASHNSQKYHYLDLKLLKRVWEGQHVRENIMWFFHSIKSCLLKWHYGTLIWFTVCHYTVGNMFLHKVLFPPFLNYAVRGNKEVIALHGVCLQCWPDISWWLWCPFSGCF